ncbi:MAG: XdhC family protein [Flavobacteriaceae bacterium]|nr:XdhC family protein [Flavobacteriaceae bacterium]
MLHELKKIVLEYQRAREAGLKTVLATVVELEGSSYRRPGVRMLLDEHGTMTGAVSGGCVEKEIWRQAQQVFQTGLPRLMTYDGRYRLGCEGILYILLEPFEPGDVFISRFFKQLQERNSLLIHTHYEKKEGITTISGSEMVLDGQRLPFRTAYKAQANIPCLEQELSPCFSLLIIGGEHDAVELARYASATGWEVRVVVNPMEEKSISDFPGIDQLIPVSPEQLDTSIIDSRTAIVLMTHSFVKDLQYLLALKDCPATYLGLLGPATRREKLLGALIEHDPGVTEEFLERLRGPAGLNIGAETPQEIAISIVAEILAVIRQQEPMPLKDKKGSIHH